MNEQPHAAENRPKVLTKILTTLLLSVRLRGLSFTSDKLIVTLKSLNSGGDPLSVDRTVTTKLLCFSKFNLQSIPSFKHLTLDGPTCRQKGKRLKEWFSSSFHACALLSVLHLNRGHFVTLPKNTPEFLTLD